MFEQMVSAIREDTARAMLTVELRSQQQPQRQAKEQAGDCQHQAGLETAEHGGQKSRHIREESVHRATTFRILVSRCRDRTPRGRLRAM